MSIVLEKYEHKLTAVILAAGSGTRMRSDVAKQSIEICGESVLHRSVDAFNRARDIDDIIVVCRASDIDVVRADLGSDFVKLSLLIPGGNTRFESAKIGFFATEGRSEFVAIHDAARCLVTPEQIDAVAKKAFATGAATAATAVTDTLKRVGDDGVICDTVSRAGMYSAQTPQIFRSELYARALDGDFSEGGEITDDNMLLERMGVRVSTVDTGKENIKITTPEDLAYAEFIIMKRGSV